MFTIKHVKSLDQIDKSTWNSTINSNIPHLKYEYLKVLEDTFKESYSFYYLLVYKDDQLIVTTTAFIKPDFYLDTPLTGKYKVACTNIRKIHQNFLKRKVLVCGCPISEFNCLNICKDYIDFRNDILKLIIEEVNLIAKENKINMVVFKDIKCECLDNESIFNDYGYMKTHSLPGTELLINFNSFDEYIKTLKKKFRDNIKNKINRSKKHEDLTVEIVEDFLPYIDDIYKLYLNTYNKSQNKFEKLTKSFFYDLKTSLGDSACAILCKVNGKLCGMTILLNSDDLCINVRIGLDYSVAYKYNLYFLMLYKNIEYAIEKNKQKLLLSQTSYRPKLELGAELTPLILYSKFNNKLTSKVYSVLFRKLFYKYTLLIEAENTMEELKVCFPDSY